MPSNEYYLTIWTNNTNPNCCLVGTIEVSEVAGLTGDSCTKIPDSALTILHDALDIAGLIPVLGAIPDGINAGIYVIEGDWVNAGISTAAMIPIFGEGVIVTKDAVKITRSAIQRLGKEGIEIGLKEAKAAGKKIAKKEVVRAEKEVVKEGAGAVKQAVKEGSETVVKTGGKEAEKAVKEVEKAAEEAAQRAERDAAKKAEKQAEKAAAEKAKKIAECEAIYVAYKALEPCRACTISDTKAELTAKIACLTALLKLRSRFLKKKCDYILAGSIKVGSAAQEKGHKKRVVDITKSLAECWKKFARLQS